MASLVINPLLQQSLKRSVLIFPKQQCRCLSSTPRLSSMRGKSPTSSPPMSSMQAQMSKIKKSSLPDDLGMQPQLLVRPQGKDLPSIISSQWRRRLRIEWTLYTQKVQSFLRLLYGAKWTVPVDPITRKKQRRPLLLRERAEIARDLYVELNTAIAARNRQKINQIACDGLKQQLRVRFDKLEATKGPAETWTLNAFKGWTPTRKIPWILQAICPAWFKAVRIVIDSEAPVPIGDHSYHRQVVARITSTQTLTKTMPGGKKSSATVDRDEYIVIQRMLVEGKDDRWKIWGTVQPANQKKVDDILQDVSSNKFRDRFNEQFQKFSADAPSM